jgi:archaellum biogenesis ATPase FlaH
MFRYETVKIPVGGPGLDPTCGPIVQPLTANAATVPERMPPMNAVPISVPCGVVVPPAPGSCPFELASWFMRGCMSVVCRPDPFIEDAIENATQEEKDAEPLDVAKSILNADGARNVALPGGVRLPEAETEYVGEGSDTISQGSVVLVEGHKGAATRAVTENLCYGLLESGRTVTYVTTALTVQDFIMEMHSHNYRIAQYLPERKVLVIPVYPLIEGKGGSEGLLDTLMTSPQLHTTDAIIVDNLSDFLGGSFDEVICMRLLEYLRNLSAMGKTVFLVVEDGQKGILSLRLASDLHFALPAEEGKGVQVKRYQPPKLGAPGVLRFRVDPALGLISQPHKG